MENIASPRVTVDLTMHRVSSFLDKKGASLTDGERADLLAILQGFKNAAHQQRYEEAACTFKVYSVFLNDYDEHMTVKLNQTTLLPCPSTSRANDLPVAIDLARDFAADQKWPVVIVDGNGTIRHEQDGSDGGQFVLMRPLGEVFNAHPEYLTADVAEDMDLVDAGLGSVSSAAASAAGFINRIASDEAWFKRGAPIIWLAEEETKKVLWRYTVTPNFAAWLS